MGVLGKSFSFSILFVLLMVSFTTETSALTLKQPQDCHQLQSNFSRYDRSLKVFKKRNKKNELKSLKQQLDSIFESRPDFIECETEAGTPLIASLDHMVFAFPRLELANYLVNAGADVNASSPLLGMTALHFTVLYYSNLLIKGKPITKVPNLIKLLVDKGADIHAKSVFGMTPIEAARAYSHRGQSVIYDYLKSLEE